jgi:hypothetical protein
MDPRWTRTEEPCECGSLQRAAEDPDLPVRFDPRMNEFNFVYTTAAGHEGLLSIHHCYICGGKAPESRRRLFFRLVPRAEQDRLWALFRPLKTLAAVLDAWGQPDQDYERGTGIQSPEKNGEPGVIQQFRTLVYEYLSDCAVVRVIVYRDDHLGVAFHGKPADPDS